MRALSVKTIEQKIGELEAAKHNILQEIESLKSRYEKQLSDIDTKIELLNNAQQLLIDDAENETSGNSTKTSETQNHFVVKGSMSLREGLIKALEESKHPLHLDDLEEALKQFGVHSDRGTIRARLTRGVQKKVFKRVAEATYALA